MRNSYSVGISSLIISGTLLILSASAAAGEVVAHTRLFEIKLGASRLIYLPGIDDIALAVNNPQNYPVLIQGKVWQEDKKTPAPFIVTPPVSRLEGHQQSRLRVIKAGEFAQDRETLSWLCVAGIPPKNTDVWAQDEREHAPSSAVIMNLEVSARQCIKLLVRPLSLSITSRKAAGDLAWYKDGKTLVAQNSSPLYVHLSSVSIGGQAVPEVTYIAPYSSRTFPVRKEAKGPVKWVVITDEGGRSRAYQSMPELAARPQG